MVNCQIYIIILGSSAIFANSACKRLIVHKVQSSLACRLQVCNSRSNLLRILSKVLLNLLCLTLICNPQKIRMRFSRMKHAISEKLYFVYYLRNGVLSSERSPKIQGLLLTCLALFLPSGSISPAFMSAIFVRAGPTSSYTNTENRIMLQITFPSFNTRASLAIPRATPA